MMSRSNPLVFLRPNILSHTSPGSKNLKQISFEAKTVDVYRQLIHQGRELLVETDINRILFEALENLVLISCCDRGIIALFDKTGKNLVEVTHNLKKWQVDSEEFAFNRSLIDEVKKTKHPVQFRHAEDNPTTHRAGKNDPHQPCYILCVPVHLDDLFFGYIYLDSQKTSDPVDIDLSKFVEDFADFISLAAHKVFEMKSSYNHVCSLEAKLRDKFHFENIIGHHPKLIEVMDLVARVARTDATVLLQGESGTGKELIARAIHYNSERADKPFVAVNCGALPDSLLESELFGHEKGAFTGAVQRSIGRFEASNDGTIFLDEIDATTSTLQVKLLRVLQTGEYTPLGSSRVKFCDVRIIAAAQNNLRKQLQEGKFREDLFYRLNIVPIFLPLLKERQDDIQCLVDHFLTRFSTAGSKPTVSNAAMEILQNYIYPGNVRELENAIRRAVILSGGRSINIEHLPKEMYSMKLENDEEIPVSSLPFHEAKNRVIEHFESDYLVKLLAKHKGVISRAAKEAAVDRKNFRQKMAKWAIHSEDFK